MQQNILFANLTNADCKYSIRTKLKLPTYITFKENIETESYITNLD